MQAKTTRTLAHLYAILKLANISYDLLSRGPHYSSANVTSIFELRMDVSSHIFLFQEQPLMDYTVAQKKNDAFFWCLLR